MNRKIIFLIFGIIFFASLAAPSYSKEPEIKKEGAAAVSGASPEESIDAYLNLMVSSLQAPVVTYEVVDGDTLGKIAKKYATTVDLIKRKNHLTSDVIRAGQKLTIWTGAFSILIDKSDNTLTVKNGEQIVKIYPVSSGQDNASPEGEFTITSKMENPVWFHKGEIVPPGTQKNFLGTRWLGFNLPQYGIHGTVQPQFIGRSVSHGCIRMRNEDVEELFTYTPIGTKVNIME